MFQHNSQTSQPKLQDLFQLFVTNPLFDQFHIKKQMGVVILKPRKYIYKVACLAWQSGSEIKNIHLFILKTWFHGGAFS